MSDELTHKLDQLLACSAVTGSDRELATACKKRLSQPLRLAIFGSHPRYCSAIINFLLGENLLPTEIKRMNTRIDFAEEESVKAQFKDGTKKSYSMAMIKDVVESNPSKMRIELGVPVLKKLSILVATDVNSETLAQSAASLSVADLVIWCGEDHTLELQDAFNDLPDLVRNHTYLLLPQEIGASPWEKISGEFAGSVRFDPRLALYAKNRRKGVDKGTFRSSGGYDVTKLLKKEIERSEKAAEDAVAVLEMRYSSELEAMPKQLPAPKEAEATEPTSERKSVKNDISDAVANANASVAQQTPVRAMRKPKRSNPGIIKLAP